MAANIYIYNWVQLGFLKIKVLNYNVAYEQIGKKWYLAETHAVHTSELKTESPQSTVDFIRTEIDSVKAERIPYKDIIQPLDNILLVDKHNGKENWAKNDSLFKKAEREGRFETVSATLLDTIKKNNAVSNPTGKKVKTSFVIKATEYLSKDNVRTVLGITKFPVFIGSQTDAVSGSVNYGWGLGYNYRLYKTLFFGLDGYTNFGSNTHAGLSTLGINLSNEFVLNRNSRSIVLTPYAGYEYIAVSYQKKDIDYNTLDCGLRISYELTHKRAVFISSGFNSASGNTGINELTINPNHYSLGLGFVFKN